MAVPPESRGESVFCRCSSAACGLRFPVTPNDAFRGRCPVCGAPAPVVATTAAVPHTPGIAAAPSPLHILLDNWRSLFNVGSAFRTADGAGVAHLYLCGITATPRQPKLAKTALGAERFVPWSYHPDAVVLAEQLVRDGARLWALEAQPAAASLFDAATDVFSLSAPQPLVLVAGNEVAGVDPGLWPWVERIVAVPMLGRKESLNVAVALSIAVYWLRGQAQSAGVVAPTT